MAQPPGLGRGVHPINGWALYTPWSSIFPGMEGGQLGHFARTKSGVWDDLFRVYLKMSDRGVWVRVSRSAMIAKRRKDGCRVVRALVVPAPQ